MIYGLYLSASGIMASSYKQDVLANNLANSETVGFKRDLAYFQERKTAMQEQNRAGDWSDPLLEHLGGGLLATATKVDHRQGDLEQTGNPLDMGIEGSGYFAVTSGGQTRLTRDGRMMTNTNNELVLANGHNQLVLDVNQKPIKLEPGGSFEIAKDGSVRQNGVDVARVGLFNVANPKQLQKMGGTLLSYPEGTQLQAADGAIHGEFVELSNVDPTTELSALMDTQRQLEANANMIRYQDATLQRLVNDVGKIG